MARYVAARLLQVVPLLFLISFLSFGLYQMQPGDPVLAYVPRELLQHPEEVERVRRALGLDRPWTVQYVRWLGRVLRGDLGRSLITGEPVAERLGRAIPRTLKLTAAAFALGLAGAVALGVLSATRRYSLADHLTTAFGFAGIAMPSFWLGVLLLSLFALHLRWLPAGGMYALGREGEFLSGLRHMVLPVLVLAFGEVAATSRYLRSSLLEVLCQEYIRTARAKGLPERIVIYRHALRGALGPVITLMGLSVAGLIGGSLVVEKLFAWPGMGRLTVDALFQHDYPVIMGANLAFALLTVLGNLAADLAYGWADPRVRFE